jgi:septal ring factor EnvC (AmiA/AmiB activator)
MRSSASPRSCTISGCKHSSRALCIDHLKDHVDKPNDIQLTSLTAEINILSDRFHYTPLVESCFLTTLDKWRTDAHRTIDRFYETQRRHFEQIIQQNRDKQRKEIDRLRLKLNDLIREQNATQEDIYLIKNTIQIIEKDLNDLQHLQCNIRPLVIDENIATIQSDK